MRQLPVKSGVLSEKLFNIQLWQPGNCLFNFFETQIFGT